jgi:hypothetical protein
MPTGYWPVGSGRERTGASSATGPTATATGATTAVQATRAVATRENRTMRLDVFMSELFHGGDPRAKGSRRVPGTKSG